MNKALFSRGIILTLLLIIFIWTFLLRFISQSYDESLDAYTLSEGQKLESIIGGTVKTYENFSLYIYSQLLSKPEVIDIVSRAYGAEETEKDALRRQLYTLLKPDYDALLDYNFGQLQFHFPDGENFLRFNEPSKHGDNILATRETVHIANESRQYAFGFEAGGNFDGYRFVYPLFDGDRYIGTAELAVSLYGAIDTLHSLNRDSRIFYMLDSNMINASVLPDHQGNYAASLISREYMIEKNIYWKLLNESAYLPYDNAAFINEIQERVKDRLGKNGIICCTITFASKNYLVHFLPIETPSHKLSGYYVSIREDQQINAIKLQKGISIGLLTAMAVMVLIFAFAFGWDKRKAYHMAMKDSLTNIAGKRDFYIVAKKEFSRSRRHSLTLCALMIDIDFFKLVNDTYGHQTGDNVLKTLVAIISGVLRESDYFARWGGEEFVVLLENTDKYTGCQIAERIRRVVDEYAFEDAGHVTVSLGIAALSDDDKTIDSLLRRADDALYKAKKDGRNRVSIGV